MAGRPYRACVSPATRSAIGRPRLLAWCERYGVVIGYDEDELDRTGNIELRCWAAVAGMLGERKPDIVSMDPSWHHNYASLGWWGGPPAPAKLHYPPIKPELVGLIDALHGIAHEAERRAE